MLPGYPFDQSVGLATPLAAIAAGAWSIGSPCVTPLAPLLAGMLAGLGGRADGWHRWLRAGALFVTGFGLLFLFTQGWLGLSASLAGLVASSNRSPAIGFSVVYGLTEALVRAGAPWLVCLGAVHISRVSGPTPAPERVRLGALVLTAGLAWALGPGTGLARTVDALSLGLAAAAGLWHGRLGAAGLVGCATLVGVRALLPIGVAPGGVAVAIGHGTLAAAGLMWLRASAGLPPPGRTSAIAGLVVGAGWTPCMGPTLGFILNVSSGGGIVGPLLLTAYAAGLGVALIVAAAALTALVARTVRVPEAVGALVPGVLLMVGGVFVMTDLLKALAAWGSSWLG